MIESYKDKKDISCIFVMVAFNTFDWIVPCIESFRRIFPDETLLVIDNNPCQGTDRSRSFRGRTVYNRKNDWSKYCKKETDWLHSVKKKYNFEVIQTPHFMEHGYVIDLAVEKIEDYDVLVHIEPDCDINGREWFDNLMTWIVNGHWMVTGHAYSSNEFHPTPSMWRLDVFRYLELSFKPFRRTVYTGQDKLFYKLVDTKKLRRQHQKWWDTGIYASYRCARKAKACAVPVPDFKHHMMGSVKRK